MEQKKELVIFKAQDGNVKLDVNIENETVWLSLDQMSELFERDKSTISRHIKNIFKGGELSQNSIGKVYDVTFYDLDVIISVGYRVKSQRGVEFRKCASGVLKDYMLKGYAVNNNRINELGEVIRIMKRAESTLDSKQILDVIEKYTVALDLLDDYDHQKIENPSGNIANYVLTYDECKNVISNMKFGNESDLFGNEKDDSFKSSINAPYQTFGGQEVYPSLEEKALNVALNKISGEFDIPLLTDLLKDLSVNDFDVSLTGFDENEISNLFSDTDAKKGKDDDYDVNKALEESAFVKQQGDLWQLGKHRMLCGDATSFEDLNRLMGDKKANLIVTDPPYNVNFESASGLKIKNDKQTSEKFYDFLLIYLIYFKNMSEHLAEGGSAYIFHADTEGLNFRKAFIDSGFHLSGVCIWAKNSFVMGRSE